MSPLDGMTSDRRNSLGRQDLQQERADDAVLRQEFRNPASLRSGNARAVAVNRTHRVVREQAMELREQRQKTRGLWAPLAISSILMLAVCYAIWAMLGGYDLTPNGIPDASDQLAILLLWSLPVTAVVMGMVWFKRGRGRLGHNGEAQP
jgi:hypothetical protein